MMCTILVFLSADCLFFSFSDCLHLIFFNNSFVEIKFTYHKFIPLKYTFSCLYIHGIVQPSTLSNFRTLSPSLKETPYPLAGPPIGLPTHPSSQQSLIHFLFAWICLYWTFHVNEIIQHVAFYDWLFSLNMFSRLIHVATCINSSFLFAA